MYQIEEISWLWLGIIPLLVMLLFIGDRIWKSNIQDNFLSKNALMRLSPNISSFKPYLRFFTILFSLSMSIIIFPLTWFINRMCKMYHLNIWMKFV